MRASGARAGGPKNGSRSRFPELTTSFRGRCFCMGKKIRFGDLVRNSGRPKVVTLWTEPSKDRSFREAIKANKVLTVMQKTATRQTDFGKIGFHENEHAAYMVFPRGL